MILCLTYRTPKVRRFSDLDLFVGGRLIPGSYPNPADSYLLKNISSQKDKVRFALDLENNKALKSLGLVKSAIWQDINSDGWEDLVITGEWMKVKVYLNVKGHLETYDLLSDEMNHVSWNNTIFSYDIDSDGDLDFLVGNLGLNSRYKASIEEPFQIYVNDFDENGKQDIVLSYLKDGHQLPVRGRECSSQQVPAISKRFGTFKAFAAADLETLYGRNMLEKSLHYEVTSFKSFWLENVDGTYKRHDFPDFLQTSNINVFNVIQDSTGEEIILAFGNHLYTEVETPRLDGSYGVEFKFNEVTKEIVQVPISIFVKNQVANAITITIGNKRGLLLAVNNDKVQFIMKE